MAYEYERTGHPLKVKRLRDGVIIGAASKEMREAVAEGRAPGPSQATIDEKARRAAKKAGHIKEGQDVDGPGRVTPPRLGDQEAEKPKKLTKREQAAEFGLLLGLAFQGFGYARNRPHWALTDAQQGELGAAVAGVGPSLPGTFYKRLTAYSPWIKLAMVSSSIVVPRLVEDQRIDVELAAQRSGGAPPRSATQAAPAAQGQEVPIHYVRENPDAVFGNMNGKRGSTIEPDGTVRGAIPLNFEQK